ncbi:ClbS/DfsB family four-helix bundle protein [Acinetobacter qingfengensis]|uniref:Uncharacterized protein n=1 Tax=Acinetobacter qingfengensis TaxID=1262585 RepID=A0A1E7QXH1_9GAMM|nr:ClbS/DfsB family four-helix bundle protein [Acinetobacter qingfengensis]KAA8731658.1 ClbS/DfsB family four-helix bundle protein [Acinetobacter qingfengensis]OEY91760.1 hypothetical protein BJI46_06360 [Acinetobacter qingfengensis]
MSVPENKQQLLIAIDKNFNLLIKKLHQVPVELAYLPVLDGHVKNTCISVAQLVAYLIGWGALVLKWHDREQQGLVIDFPETGYKWNQLGLLAQKFYQDYAAVNDYVVLLKKLTENQQAIKQLVSRFDDQQLYGQVWYGKWPRGRMIQFNTASPYKNAVGRLNAWFKQSLQK